MSHDEICLAVINDELQYSIWPAWKALPAGWREVYSGAHSDCLAFIKENWTDLRPRSAREIKSEALPVA